MSRAARLATAAAGALLASACISTYSTVRLTAADSAAIRSYAIAHFSDDVGSSAARVGCAFHNFGGSRDGDATTVYVVMMCTGESASTDCSDPGSAGDYSIPTRVRLRAGRVTSWEQPGNGEDFWPGIKRLFPSALRHRMSQPPSSVINDLDKQVRDDLGCAGHTSSPVALPPFPPCHTMMAASLGPLGVATGTTYQQVDLQNRSREPCLLRSFPDVVFLNAADRPIHVPLDRVDFTSGKTVVALKPEQYANFVIGLAAPDGPSPTTSTCRPIEVHALRITWAGNATTLTVPMTGPVCTLKNKGVGSVAMISRFGLGRPSTPVGTVAG